jgi:SAM-dependent methyltransferase
MLARLQPVTSGSPARRSGFVPPSWRVWDLDAEMRYLPVLGVLPADGSAICEVGSGAAGLARWTDRPVIGIDPGPDERHGELTVPANLTRVDGRGEAIPLDDAAVAACVAIDTLEHVPATMRAAVIAEMVRVTKPGGVVVLMGPAGAEAALADRRLLDTLHRRGTFGGWTVWLEEHLEFGLPTVEDLETYLTANQRVNDVDVRGELNLRLWWAMHRAAMGVPRRGPLRRIPHPTPVHAYVWTPLAVAARSYRRGPFYRYMLVARVDH